MDAFHRIVEVARKELLELWRNAGIVAFILAIPVIEMVILGYATAGGINDLPAAIYDADHTPSSRELLSAIHHARSFEVTTMVDTVAQAEQLMDEGQVSALFIIPQGFEGALIDARDDATVVAVIDGSNTAVANYAAIYAEGLIQHFLARNLEETIVTPIRAEPRIWYNQELRRENFYIPALLGTMLALVILAITAVCIVRERERGTLEQLMVSPIEPLELILGKLAPVILIAYVELALMLVIATQLFNVPIRGRLSLYLALMFVYLLAEMGVGVLISTLSTSQAQALPTIFLLVTTDSILAGFISPVETMPEIAQRISALVPLRYFIAITRALFAKGATFQELAPQLMPLVGMGILFFTTSTLLLRRRLV